MTNIRYQIGILAITALASISGAAQTSTSVDLGTIVQRIAQTQVDAHNNVRPYEVTREYQFFEGEDDGQPESHVVADVTYFPPDTKQYSIRNTSGSGRGQHVVKKVLEHETQMVGQWRQSALTDENYKFSMLGEETLNGRRCFILGLEPRREAKELLKGKAWVDAEDFRVRQVQGEPSKSPSFWIKKLNVTLTFSEVQGMWLQTAVRASAEVRMFGRNTLAERDLTYRVGNAMAAKKTQRRSSAETQHRNLHSLTRKRKPPLPFTTGAVTYSCWICKPNSVRGLRREAVIPLGRALLTGSSDLPGSCDAPSRHVVPEGAIPPYLVLLRVGFAMPRHYCAARCALTAPFHPYPRLRARRYILCGTFRRRPLKATSRTLSGTPLCGVRTFLFPAAQPGQTQRSQAGSDRPIQRSTLSII